MARQIILMRHAAVGPAYAERYLGSTDVPIDAAQAQSIEGATRWLLRQPIGRCYCSPMLRARQTADLIMPNTTLPISVNDDLREVDFGAWEGKTFDEISRSDALLVDKWAKMDDDFAFPQGESMQSFQERISRAWETMIADPADVVLGLTHGGVIRSMICHALGLARVNYILFSVRYASCAVIDVFDGNGILSGLNLPANAEGR